METFRILLSMPLLYLSIFCVWLTGIISGKELEITNSRWFDGSD